MTSEVISTPSVQRRVGEPPPIFDLPTTYSAALFPARAWGMFPLACVLVACSLGAFALDVLSGHGVLGTEVVHALEGAGLACLWVVARRSAHRPSEVRVA